MAEFVPTDEQKAILGHKPGQHARVLAGPGTGKSATLVALIDKLLKGKPKPKLKLLTFTRAATGELAKKVSEHPAAAAERPSTIHSFAISVLLRNQGAGDFPQPLRIADDWELSAVVHPTLAKRARVPVPKIERLIREMAANWESLRPGRDPKVDATHRARFLGAWNEHREILGYTLLSELPYQLRAALQTYDELDGVSFDLLIVDEYQDLNACDLEVLRLIASRGCSIVGAGDDDQSIYSFRKAAPEGIRRFLDDYSGSADYPLSITQRCGAQIIEWASYVIEGDPDRPADRPRLLPAEGSPDGETALLAFSSERGEAEGIAQLVKNLIEVERLSASDILILFRGDFRGSFSKPVKVALKRRGIPFADPDSIKLVLSEEGNRRVLETLRLVINPTDSLAWASLLALTDGIGIKFFDYVYDRARVARAQFGSALLEAYEAGFPDAPAASANRARSLIEQTRAWLEEHRLDPGDEPEEGWGQWILAITDDGAVGRVTEELRDLLLALDELVEAEQGLSRYLGQVTPLGKDRALAESSGVRIMSMGGAKGLTVGATIMGAVEEGIMPRPDVDRGEERRLLYVAMTRARRFVYATWTQRRRGPTARSGAPRVGTLRRPSSFLEGGPVVSGDGPSYISRRWPNT
jgi:DNA helicase-2/ATP-dependent DNA helicase PcrA